MLACRPSELAGRLRYTVQSTTDGNSTYLEAVEVAFGADVGYTCWSRFMVPHRIRKSATAPLSAWAWKSRIQGQPATEHVSTSYIERQNLTMHVDAAVHTVNQCLLEETGEPHACHLAALHVL